MWILTQAVAVLGALLLAASGILGYKRVLRIAEHAEAADTIRAIRRWSLGSGIGLSLVLGAFSALMVAQSASELGWSQQHGLVLTVLLIASVLGGAWTTSLFYWETVRKVKRRAGGRFRS